MPCLLQYSSLPTTNILPLPPSPLAFPPGVCMIHGGFTGEIPLLPIAKMMPMPAPSSKTPPLQPAGCCIASLWAASASRTLVNTTYASLPSPPPPPLVASCSCPPWLVVVLSPTSLQLCDRHPSPLPPVVGCCVFRPLHPLSSLLHGLSSHCAIASCSPSLASLVRLVVASPLLTPAPPVGRHLRLSSRRCLSSRHGLLYLLSGWLLHCLYSRRHLPSAGVSASHCAIASHTPCPAGCCITSVAHPLCVPLRLVVASPLPHILSVRSCLSTRPCLSMHNLHLPPPIRLLLLPLICWRLRLSSHHHLLSCHGLPYLLSGWLLCPLYWRRHLPSASVLASHHAVASRRAMASRTSCPAGCHVASAAHPLVTPLQLVVASPPPLILSARPCLLTCHPLGAPLPLDAPPPPPTSRLPFAATSHLLASAPLIAPSPLVAPWPPVPLVRLVIASPPPLILLALLEK